MPPIAAPGVAQALADAETACWAEQFLEPNKQFDVSTVRLVHDSNDFMMKLREHLSCKTKFAHRFLHKRVKTISFDVSASNIRSSRLIQMKKFQ